MSRLSWRLRVPGGLGGSRAAGTLEAWRHLAAELGGQLEFDRKGKPRRVTVPHRGWRVVLDTYVQSHGQSASTWTRVRALFPKREPFSLQVTPRTPFHRLARLVGYGGIDLGYQRADRILFVRSDRPDRARAMLRGTALGTLLLRDPKGKLLVTRPEKRIRKIAGDSVGEVRMLRGGRIVDLAALRSMVQIVMETLDQLAGLGVAGDAPVEEVEL